MQSYNLERRAARSGSIGHENWCKGFKRPLCCSGARTLSMKVFAAYANFSFSSSSLVLGFLLSITRTRTIWLL